MSRRTLRTGPDRDYRLYAEWEGDGPCNLQTAAARLHIVDDRRQSRLLSLGGVFAARLFYLLNHRERHLRDGDFNCFAAVETLAAGTRPRGDLLEREPMGPEFGRDESLPELEPPFVFQMHGEWLGEDEVLREGIIHEGVVLDPVAAHGEPLVFHKCGPLRCELAPWRKALMMYRRSARLHFGELLSRPG